MSEYDSVVIGGGQAGPFLAVKLAGGGQRVAVVEREALGGTCVNRGCTPTKTLRKSARVAYMARRAAEFGVQVGPVTVDFRTAMERMAARVDASREGLTGWLQSVEGLTVHFGTAALAGRGADDRFVVHIDGQPALTAERVFLNVGTQAFVPPIPGLRELALTSRDLLALRERPERLLVLGGSYIGLELGQIFARLGSEVQVVEAGPRVASREDPDISEAIEAMLTVEGVQVHTGASASSVRREGDEVVVELGTGGQLRGTHLLAATGRSPNTSGIGLDTIGLATDARGYIETNGRLETAVSGVYALGDINRRGAFTHTSYHDHEVVADHLAGGDRTADDRVMTYAMFTDPPLGHVGIHEAEARALVAEGRRISLASVDMAAVSRAKEESETVGRIKMWIDEDSGLFLGASLLGIQADEIVQAIGLVMASGGTVHDVMTALPVHPTVTEFFPTVLGRRQPVEPN